MDELGGYPRMHQNRSNFSQNPDQNGSWFGLAITGLKFLINNQSNNNINHNLNSQSTNPNNNSTKVHNNMPSQKQQQQHKKLHILGPSVFKKQLYDIPEYQSMQIKGDKSNLTQQALKQFNGNFSNYWNQRSSLHSHHSSDHSVHSHNDNDNDNDDNYSNGGSVTSHPSPTQQTDGGSTIHQQTEEYQPSMTSSQIIHPTQDKQKQSKMHRSRSFPLLHSAEYIQNFEQFSRDIMEIKTNTETETVSNVHNYDEEGSQCNFIPSPPPISNTPDHNMSLPAIHNVHAIKSWETIKSAKSIKSIGSDSFESKTSNNNTQITDSNGIVLIDNHFIKEKQNTVLKQRQWLQRNVSEMDTVALYPNQMKARKSYNANTSKSSSETDWADNETIQVISCPLPKSMKPKKKKKKRKYSDSNDEDIAFSDWSNVSSNVTPP